jgi:hypothetical protein
MPLEFGKVVNQIDHMGQMLAERSSRQRRALRPAQELLHQFAEEHEHLREVADSQDGQRLRCASPGEERMDSAIPAPSPPEHVTLIASDGSQIYPDSHGLAFYYVINIGSIVFRQGSGQAPDVTLEPRLTYAEDKVYPEGRPATSDLVSAERNLAEMKTLTDLTIVEPQNGSPRLALADGPLLIWLQRANLPEGRGERFLNEYLSCLDRLRASSSAVAGFVSRPRSAEVIVLLYLAQLEAGLRHTVQGLHQTDYRGLTDRALFSYLEPGERSSLFIRGTQENQSFSQRGHAVFFFYLNTGNDLARVEVPEWVVADPVRLELVHAVTYGQCQLNNGYPYVLTRADEEAVILGEEREMLELMISQAMVRHGMPLPELSRKAQQKQVARWRRSR